MLYHLYVALVFTSSYISNLNPPSTLVITLPYEHIRWIENPEEVDVNRIVGTSDMKKIKDLKGNPLLVFANSWSVNMVLERNEGLKLSEFGKNN